MRTQVKKISKIVLTTIILCAMSFSTNAQIKKKKRLGTLTNTSKTTLDYGCNQALVKKSGEVYSVANGILSTRATSNKVKVSVKKTGGRAATQVNIYVDNVLRSDDDQRIIFLNGRNTTPFISREISGVKGKMIKVEIVNQSSGSTFKYTAKIIGKTPSLMPNLKPVSGRLVGQGFKNIFTKRSCSGKIKITIRRTGGKARGSIQIFERGNNGNYTNKIEDVTFAKEENEKVFEIDSTRKLKIVLKNVSVGKTIKYKIDAVSIQ